MAGLFCIFMVTTALYGLASSYLSALEDGDDSEINRKNLSTC